MAQTGVTIELDYALKKAHIVESVHTMIRKLNKFTIQENKNRRFKTT